MQNNEMCSNKNLLSPTHLKIRTSLVKYQNLSNENLLFRTQELVRSEREVTIEVLHHLLEIERRKLFLDRGFPSLFAYAVKCLGYSDNEAYSRIESMRLLRDLPEIEPKIQDGSISLTSASKLQKFLKTEKKDNRVSTTAEKMEIVKSIENKSTREVEKTLFELNPSSLPEERVRVVSAEHTELKIILDEDLKKELDRIKELLSHQYPNMSYTSVLKYLSKLGLQKLDPSLKTQRKATVAPKVTFESKIRVEPAVTRYISAAIKTHVWKRDGGCCTFVDPLTQAQCKSRRFIQYDHILPFALGGETTTENIRLLCGAHNRRRAEKTFGRHWYS